MSDQTLVEKFRSARADPALAVLEGFHPLKHAIRFGANLEIVVGVNLDELAALGKRYGPDIASALETQVDLISEDDFQQLAPVAPPGCGSTAG